MKKYILSFILSSIFTGFFLYSCDMPEPRDSKVGETLTGSHTLGKLMFHSADSVQSGNSLFKISGETLIFSWKMNDGSFTTAQIPLAKIRIAFNPNCEQAFVKFRWLSGETPNLTEIYNSKIVYAVITCREEDFPKPKK